MTKKLISTVLCLVMLLSVVGVSAAGVNDPTYGTDRITYTDNFNDQVDGTIVNEKDTASGNPYVGDVLDAANNTSSSGSTGKYSKGYAVMTANAGPDNTTAMVFPARNDLRRLATKSLEINTSSVKEYKLSYDFKVSNNTNQVDIMTHGGTYSVLFSLSNGKIMNTTNGSTLTDSGVTYSAETWYKVVSITKGQKMIGWLCDAAGNSLAYSESERIKQNTFLQIFNIDNANAANVSLTLDNVELVEYNPATVAPSVVTAPSISGSTSVPTETTSVSVTMDQPLDVEGSTATLNGTECAITQDSSKALTYTITLPTLTGGTPYTLDLSGLKNSGGASAGSTATYSFTTAAPYVTPDVAIATPANGATDVSRDIASMRVTFNKAMATVPSTVTLTGGTSNITATVNTTDNTTYTFTWEEKLANNTTYSVSLAAFKDAEDAAPTTASLSFTTENTGIVQLTDDILNKASFGTSEDAIQITTGGTQTGSNIQALATAATYTPASQEVDGETVYEKFIVTYKVNLKDVDEAAYGTDMDFKDNDTREYTDGGANIKIGADDGDLDSVLAAIMSDAEKAYIGSSEATSNKIEISKDHWYNVVLTFDGNNQTFAFIDAEGENQGQLIWSKAMTGGYTAGSAITIYPLDARRYTRNSASKVFNSNMTVLMDDFTLWKIKPWSEDHALTVNSIAEENGTFTMTFNQPVMVTNDTKDMLAVATATGEPPYNYDVEFDAAFTYPDFCTQVVTVSGLFYVTDYVLDYSGIVALSGSAISESVTSLKTFTTGHDTEYDVSFVGNATYAEGNVSFELYSAASATPDVFVAYYKEGDLVAVKVPAETVSIAAAQKAEVSVAAIADDFDYIKVFVWNEGLQPIMRVYDQVMSFE